MKCGRCGKVRIIIAFAILFSSFFIYLINSNLSILIVVMVKSHQTIADDNYGPRYNWSETDQATIFAAYSIGYVIISLFGSILPQVVGPRIILGVTFFCGGLVTALTPFIMELNTNYLLQASLRLLIGLFMGSVLPSCHKLISHWVPPKEQGMFFSTIVGGGTLGTVITFPFTTYLIQNFGWKTAFIVEGIMCMNFAIVLFILVTNIPEQHWFITTEETTYIRESMAASLNLIRNIPPYIKIISTVPFLILVLLDFSNLWGLTLLVIYAPKYLIMVLKYDLYTSGYLAFLPSLCCGITAGIYGFVLKIIMRKQCISVLNLRKLSVVSSHFIPGIFFSILSSGLKERQMVMMCLVLVFTFTGAVIGGHLAAYHDISPNYASTLISIASFFSHMSGIISPLTVGFIVKDGTSPREYNIIFFITACVKIIPAIIFFIFGSVKQASWDSIQKNEVVIEKSEVE